MELYISELNHFQLLDYMLWRMNFILVGSPSIEIFLFVYQKKTNWISAYNDQTICKHPYFSIWKSETDLFGTISNEWSSNKIQRIK